MATNDAGEWRRAEEKTDLLAEHPGIPMLLVLAGARATAF